MHFFRSKHFFFCSLMNVLELGFNLRGGGCKMKDETNINVL